MNKTTKKKADMLKNKLKKLLNLGKPKFFTTRPVSRCFGFDRGTPIDRYYIENFLNNNNHLIKGKVLEIGENTYTIKFGIDKVTESKVLHFTGENSNATIIGDLVSGEGIPKEYFDCFILTQTFPFIYDLKSALKNALLALKKGGYLLITVPGITQISRYDYERWGHFWSFTDMSVKNLFKELVPEKQITVNTYGNVKSASMFLYGYAQHEISKKDLEYNDPDFQMLISAIVRK